jgi:cyclopropane fatty-acyl-phospholipid synthase-like methyltransferase
LKAELADSPRKLLEVGSGTGQHALQFSAALPQVHWQCSEVADALPLLAQRLGQAGLGNLPQPIELDVAASAWPTTTYDAIYSANTLHIMRWREVERFFAGATRALKPGGKLLVYGPYHRCGQPTSDGNRDFDASLRRDDPERGIRDTADMDTLAAHHDLQLDADIPMPANNALRVWVKSRAEG